MGLKFAWISDVSITTGLLSGKTDIFVFSTTKNNDLILYVFVLVNDDDTCTLNKVNLSVSGTTNQHHVNTVCFCNLTDNAVMSGL